MFIVQPTRLCQQTAVSTAVLPSRLVVLSYQVGHIKAHHCCQHFFVRLPELGSLDGCTALALRSGALAQFRDVLELLADEQLLFGEGQRQVGVAVLHKQLV